MTKISDMDPTTKGHAKKVYGADVVAELEAVQDAQGAPALATFELDDTALKAIARKGGREAAPALYLEEVRSAIGSDKAFGIPVPEGTKGTKITAELRKAAKSLGVHVRLWDRSGAKTPEGAAPFVGFKVIDKPADNPGTPVSEHGQPDGDQ